MNNSAQHLCTIAPMGLQFANDGQSSILDSALASGISVPFSCKRGECGSCRAQLQEGSYERIAAPSEYAYRVADNELLLCQCRATADMTLRFAHWSARAPTAGRHTARIVSLDALAPEVIRLIVHVQGMQPFNSLPGQHVKFLLDDDEQRCFSIAHLPGGAGANQLEFHLRRVAGGAFTDHTVSQLKIHDTLEIEGPHGACVWEDTPKGIEHLVLLATGTGYAGIARTMVAALEGSTLKTVTLYWGARGAEDHYASAQLNHLQDLHPHFRWLAVLPPEDAPTSAPPTAAKPPRHVQDHALAHGHHWTRTMVHACGNPAMVRAARDALTAAGLPAERYLSEAFLPAAQTLPVKTAQLARHAWEKVGAQFSMEGILAARSRSIQAVQEIAALMEPGMTTGEAIALADKHLQSMGSAYNWHPTYIRFGPDTQCTWRQPVERHRTLHADDIFVIDIGPVWDGYEGDYGDTFVLGSNADYERCAQAARDIFMHTRAAWMQGLAGDALYEHANTLARKRGYVLVQDAAGHRVSDFPHALYGKHRLAEADFVPDDGIWVLEIQVQDAVRPIGAFFEDVLLKRFVKRPIGGPARPTRV